MNTLSVVAWLRQLIKFALVGVSSFLLDLLIYIFLTRTIGWFRDYYIVANALAFLCTVLWSFTINRLWTFKMRNGFSTRQYSKFLIVSTVGLAMSSGLLYLIVEKLQLYDVAAKFLIAIVVMLWNFNANKFWTFRAVTTSQHEN